MRARLVIPAIALAACACTQGIEFGSAEAKLVEEGIEGGRLVYRISLRFPRNDALLIERKELSVSGKVTDCKGREVATFLLDVEGEPIESFGFSEHPDSSFVAEGEASISKDVARQPMCARLIGGSYTLQRVGTREVPIRVATD